MRTISLWQPWASAIALGAKRVETRSWATNYRGPLAIHAAKRFMVNEMIHYASCWNWKGALRGSLFDKHTGRTDWENFLPLGCVVATCELVECRPTGSFTLQEIEEKRRPLLETSDIYDWTERQMGDFGLGRFGWVLKNIKPLPHPVPWKGSQGFFEVPDDLLT
jgi:hypothetical protein